MSFVAERAPPRGRYDRDRPAVVRMLEQRERVLAAVAVADWTGERTIARVTAIAGVGRSTVYEYFDDFEHAIRQVSDEACGVAQERLAEVSLRDGRSSLRALCEAWLLCVDEAPLLFLSALSHTEAVIARPACVLDQRLSEWTRRHSPTPTNDMKWMLTSAAQSTALALAREHFETWSAKRATVRETRSTDTEQFATPRAPRGRPELARALTEVAYRLLEPR